MQIHWYIFVQHYGNDKNIKDATKVVQSEKV